MDNDRKIPVLIRVSGFHAAEGENDGTIEENEGFFSKRGNSVYLVYGSEDRTNSMIKVTPKQVIYKRSMPKEETASFIYREKESVRGFCKTPFGMLEIETWTDSIIVSEDPESFRTDISGRLKINGSPVSVFKLSIEAAER